MDRNQIGDLLADLTAKLQREQEERTDADFAALLRRRGAEGAATYSSLFSASGSVPLSMDVLRTAMQAAKRAGEPSPFRFPPGSKVRVIDCPYLEPDAVGIVSTRALDESFRGCPPAARPWADFTVLCRGERLIEELAAALRALGYPVRVGAEGAAP